MKEWNYPNKTPKDGSKIEYMDHHGFCSVAVYLDGMLTDFTPWEDVIRWWYIDENYMDKVKDDADNDT